jgi:cytochrome P450
LERCATSGINPRSCKQITFCRKLFRYAGRPDSQPLFTRLAAAALAEGHGLFRLSFFRFVPFLSREWVFVADIGLARELLSQERYGAFQKGNFYQLAAPLIGSGMLAAPDGPDWKHTRRMATPGFHPSMLRLAVTVAAETTRKMCERWERTIAAARGPAAGFEANMLDEMLRLTVDVLGRTAFSYDFLSVRPRYRQSWPAAAGVAQRWPAAWRAAWPAAWPAVYSAHG